MKKNEIKLAIILIFIILLFLLLFIFYTLLQTLEAEENKDIYVDEGDEILETVEETENDKIKKIIEKYGSKYIKREGVSIYVEFAKDLYDEKGSSNRNYFENIINELIPFLEKNSFYILDDEKEIFIFVKYEAETNEYKIIINDIEDFYNNTEGKKYVLVEESEIVPKSKVKFQDQNIITLSFNDFTFNSIKDELGEGIELDDGYKSYLDGAIKLRTVLTGGVRNIVFNSKYEGNITPEITTKTNLKEIKEIYPDNAFGSLSEDYLGYRQQDYYVFFYDNEISLYPYSYKNNKTFESILEDYIETRNLEFFVKNLRSRWLAYDYLEYDLENKTADILYSTRGIHIKIDNNNPKGIKLYSNYYFTDYTKSLVKKGIIDFEPNVDLVEKTELERRKIN